MSVVCFVVFMSAAFCTSVLAAQTGTDLAISAAVTEALTRENPLEYTRIDVKTFDGVVILGGFVNEYYKMQQVIEIARRIQGVKSVDNRIDISDRE